MNNGEQQRLSNSWVSTFKTENVKHNTNYESSFAIVTERNLDDINSQHENEKKSANLNESSTSNNLSDSFNHTESTMTIRNEYGEKIKFDSDNDTIAEDLYESSVQSSERSMPNNIDNKNDDRNIKTPTNSENVEENCQEIVIGDVEKKAEIRDLNINEVKNILSKISTSVPTKHGDQPDDNLVIESIKCKDINDDNKDLCEPSIQSFQESNPNNFNESSDVDEICERTIRDAEKPKIEESTKVDDKDICKSTIQTSQSKNPASLNKSSDVDDNCKEMIIGDIEQKPKSTAMSIDEVKDILSKIKISVPIKYEEEEEETDMNVVNEEIQCQNVEKLRQYKQSEDLDESMSISNHIEELYNQEMENITTPIVTQNQFAPYPNDSLMESKDNLPNDESYGNTAPYPNENVTLKQFAPCPDDSLMESKDNLPNDESYDNTAPYPNENVTLKQFASYPDDSLIMSDENLKHDRIYGDKAPYPNENVMSSDYQERLKFSNDQIYSTEDQYAPYPNKSMTSSDYVEKSRLNDNYIGDLNEPSLPYPTNLPEISTNFEDPLPYPTNLSEIPNAYDSLPYQSDRLNGDFNSSPSYFDKDKKLIGFEPISVSLEDRDKNDDLDINQDSRNKGFNDPNDYRLKLDDNPKSFVVDDKDKGRGKIKCSARSEIRTDLPLCNKCYKRHTVIDDRDISSSMYSSIRPLPKRTEKDASKSTQKLKKHQNSVKFDIDSYSGYSSINDRYNDISLSPKRSRNDLLSPRYHSANNNLSSSGLDRSTRYMSPRHNYSTVRSSSSLSPRLDQSRDVLSSPRLERNLKYDIDSSSRSQTQNSYKRPHYPLNFSKFENLPYQSNNANTIQYDTEFDSSSSVKHIISKYLTDPKSNREPNFLNNYDLYTNSSKLRTTPSISRIQYTSLNFDKPASRMNLSSPRRDRDNELDRSPLSPRRQLEDSCGIRVYCRGKLIHDPI